nr:hypothetical protein [Candidatus Sigynarchaeum springense]
MTCFSWYASSAANPCVSTSSTQCRAFMASASLDTTSHRDAAVCA